MATSSVCVFLVTIVLLAAVSDTMGFCNLLVTKFRLLGCAANRRFPCGLIDTKLNLLGCKQFACEGYRDEFGTFCTPNCRDLEISNGLCRFGTKCCLSTNEFNQAALQRVPGTDAFELTKPDDSTDPGAN